VERTVPPQRRRRQASAACHSNGVQQLVPRGMCWKRNMYFPVDGKMSERTTDIVIQSLYYSEIK